MANITVDPEALLCVLVLAPNVYARNRFFDLHRGPEMARVRRRAQRLRGMLKELVGDGRQKAEIVGTQVQGDGRVLLRYEIESIGLRRSASLSALEAATLRFALHKAGVAVLERGDREVVLGTLRRLGEELITTVTDSGRPA